MNLNSLAILLDAVEHKSEMVTRTIDRLQQHLPQAVPGSDDLKQRFFGDHIASAVERDALVDIDLPSYPAQERRSKQSGNRTANNYGAVVGPRLHTCRRRQMTSPSGNLSDHCSARNLTPWESACNDRILRGGC